MSRPIKITTTGGISALGGLSSTQVNNYFACKVGIGVNRPAAPFHVCFTGSDGPRFESSSGSSYLFLKSSSTTNNSILYMADASSLYSGAVIYNHQYDYMALRTNGGEKLRIRSSGEVGIGNDEAEQKLTVSGNVSACGGLSAHSHANKANYFSGNVGIGTNRPGYALTIDNGDLLVCMDNGGYFQADESADAIKHSDNVKAMFGTGNDLQIYHCSSGENSYIDNSTGDLFIRNNSNDSVVIGHNANKGLMYVPDGRVELRFNDAKKFETTNSGVCVTGGLSACNTRNGIVSAGRDLNTIFCTVGNDCEGTVTSITAGDGLDGGTITSSGTIAVNSTVVRTTGSQTIAGDKTFTGNTTMTGDLSVRGSVTCIDTKICTTSAIEVRNSGTGPAILANQTGAQPVVDFQDDGTSAFYIENGGNVGIGCTNPTEKLEVAGNIIAKDGGFLAGVGGDKDGFVFHDLYTAGGNYYGLKAFSGPTRLSIVTDGVEYLTTNANGCVGIKTTAPGQRLTVAGNISACGGLSATQMPSYFACRVGIGTSRPAYTLDVQSSDELLADFYSSDNHGYLRVRDNSDSYFIGSIGGTGYIGGQNSLNASNLNIDLSDGDVGIGTTTPNEKLTVSGNVSALGHICTTCCNVQGKLVRGTSCVVATKIDSQYVSNVGETNITSGCHGCVQIGTSKAYGIAISASPTRGCTAAVGIGTDPTTATLHVSGAGYSGGVTKICVSQADDGAGHPGADAVMQSSGWGEAFVCVGGHYIAAIGGGLRVNNSSSFTDFTQNASSKMRLDSSGCLGIATTTPNERLTVKGNISACGTIEACGSICTDGFLYAQCGRFSSDVCIGGDALIFPNDSYAAYICSADQLVIDVDYNANDTNRALMVCTGGKQRARIINHGLSSSGGLSATGSYGATNYFAGNVGIGTNRPDGALNLADSCSLRLGTGGDFRFYHNGTNNCIESHNGDIIFYNYDHGEDIIFCAENSSGTAAEYIRIDSSASNTCVKQDFRFADNVKAGFGTAMNMSICNDGTHSYIANGANSLYIRTASSIQLENSDGSEDMATFAANGAVSLFNDNVKKFETTSTGITVHGNVSACGGLSATQMNSYFACNVGIGTNRPDYTLDVAGNIGVDQYIYHNGDADTYINFTDDDINIQAGGVNFIDLTQDTVSEITFNEEGANVDFRVEGDTETNLLFTDASTDRVGIGTDTPTYTLDVVGNIGMNEYLYHNGDGDTYLRYDTNLVNLVAGGKSALKYDASSSKIVLNNTNADVDVHIMADNGNEILATDAANNRVGINTTTPNEALTVKGNISASGDICITDDLVVNGESITVCGPSAALNLCDTTDSDDMWITYGHGGTMYACVGYLGTTDFDICTTNRDIGLLPGTANVGIGTTSPDNKLDVEASDNSTSDTTGVKITNCSSTTNSNAGILFQNYDNNGAWIRSIRTGSANGKLSFGTNSGAGIAESNISQRMVIDHNGCVGINTNIPNETLTVVGDISATQCFRFPCGLYLKDGTSSSFQVTNPNGYVQIGPQNSSWMHFSTDRSRFYFNKCLVVNDGVVRSYDEDMVIAGNYTGTACDVIIKTDNTDRIHVEAAGNVGIGVAVPNQKLTVCGSLSSHSKCGGYCSDNKTYNTKIGSDALQDITSGRFNTALGYQASMNATCGDQNVTVGYNAALAHTEGNYNVVIGSQAHMCNTTCENNTAVGYLAGLKNTANSNSFFGAYAAACNTSGVYNTAIGYASQNYGTTGGGNTSVGYTALYINNAGGAHNTALGSFAMLCNTSGSCNIAVGTCSLCSNTTSCDNVAVGFRANCSTTTGSKNVGVGSQPLICNVDGAKNVAVGYQSMYYNVSGSNNVAIGCRALMMASSNVRDIAGSCNNIGIGEEAAQYVSTGQHNIGIGYRANMGAAAGLCGNQNIGIGCIANQCITTGAANIAMGNNAGGGTTTGNFSVSIGACAGSGPQTVGCNISIGLCSGQGYTSGCNNVGLGLQTLNSNTTGNYNFAVGLETLKANTCGHSNIGIGFRNLRNNTEGEYNTALGFCALNANTSGDWNIAIGQNSLKDNTTGKSNIAQGYYAMCNNCTGCYNIALGHQALFEVECTNNNIGIGFYAGLDITGSDNVVVGVQAMQESCGANCNVAIGTCAGHNTTSTGSVLIGYQAGTAQTTAVNTAVGLQALNAATDGGENVAVGVQALLANCSGYQNVAVGNAALGANTTGLRNTAVGCGAAYSNTTGDCNVALGCQAGYSNCTGNSNVAIGSKALYSSTVGDLLAVGSCAATANTTGVRNTAVGNKALQSNVCNNDNTALGICALNASTSNSNTAIGSRALQFASTGDGNNTAVGYAALYCNTSNAYNTAVGSNALYQSTGIQNTALGYAAAYANAGGDCNVAIGAFSLYCNTCGDYNVAIGRTALRNNTCGLNVGIGYAAGYNGSTADQIVAVGGQSLFTNITGVSQTAVGYRALYESNAPCNTAVGACALNQNETGISNTAVGYRALCCNCTTNENTAVGSYAMSRQTGFRNVGVGYGAGCTTSGHCNVFIGWETGRFVCLACRITALGYQAVGGSGCKTGGNLVAVGFATLCDNTTGSGSTAVGYQTLQKNTTGSHNVGLGQSALYNNTCGGCNVGIGVGAGNSNVSGHCNIYIGSCAGNSASTGSCNTVVGSIALRYNDDGGCNVAIGLAAGSFENNGSSCICSPDCNTYLGACTRSAATGATNETVIGYCTCGCGNNTVSIGNCNLGVVYINGDLNLKDSNCLRLGDDDDLKICHDGSNGYIVNGTADLYICSTGDDVVVQGADDVDIKVQGGEMAAKFGGNSSVDLYHNNSKKFVTTSGGSCTTGTHCATTCLRSPAVCGTTSVCGGTACFSCAGIGTSASSCACLTIGGAGACGCGCGTPSIIACYGVNICGTLSKSSGCFDIVHPLPELSASKRLSHSFVEAPQADNIYSGVVELTAGKATVNIDNKHGMTSGTLTALNRCFRTFTTNETNWDPVRGSVSGNLLTVESCVADSTATVSWMVLGERHDPHMYDNPTTDEDGRVRVEYNIPEETEEDTSE